jgi:S-DNA-T family DNA segregation ATPase FtsK/SpoIIIE
MRATDRSLDIISFVSEHFRDIIRRRLSELAGLALIALALLGALALATWSVQDPSLSHATQKPIHNLLGFPGAVFSDLAMQLLGLAAILLLVPEALLGWRLISHRPLGEKWRGMLWIVATFLGAAFASTLPRIGSWPLPTGLGGVAGDALVRMPAMIVGGHVAGLGWLILCIVFGLATVVTLAMAAKAPPRARKSVAREIDEDDEIDEDQSDDDRGSAWLGMIVHALLSWKARIGRMIRGEARACRWPRREVRAWSRASTVTDAQSANTKMTLRRTRRTPCRAGAPRHDRRHVAPEVATRCPLSISWPRRAPASVPLCRATSSIQMPWHWKACCRTLGCAGKS